MNNLFYLPAVAFYQWFIFEWLLLTGKCKKLRTLLKSVITGKKFCLFSGRTGADSGLWLHKAEFLRNPEISPGNRVRVSVRARGFLVLMTMWNFALEWEKENRGGSEIVPEFKLGLYRHGFLSLTPIASSALSFRIPSFGRRVAQGL